MREMRNGLKHIYLPVVSIFYEWFICVYNRRFYDEKTRWNLEINRMTIDVSTVVT